MFSWEQLEPLLCMIGLFAILAMSLNVMCGMTGLLQLGHAGFFAVGAYTGALVGVYWTVPALGSWNLILAMAAAVILCCGFALLIGLPCLRLRGDYLAIATLGFGEVVRLSLGQITFSGGRMFTEEVVVNNHIVQRPAAIGGALGISLTDINPELWPNYPNYQFEYASWWLIWIAVAVTYLLLINIKHSRIGRALLTIRDDEIAARAMGVNVPWYKLLSFLLAASFAGVAGVLFFYHRLSISPNDFNLLISIQILLMVVLGGMGSFSGSILAAALLMFLPVLIGNLDAYLPQTNPFLLHIGPVDQWLDSVFPVRLGRQTQVIYALLLIVLIRMAPNGILGLHELPGWLRRVPSADSGSEGGS